MKKYILTALCFTLSVTLFISCKKQSVPVTTNGTNATLEGKVLSGFANQLVNPNYEDIQTKAGVMVNAANALYSKYHGGKFTGHPCCLGKHARCLGIMRGFFVWPG